MSLAATVEDGVALAFDLIGDLKTEITFYREEPNGFDFEMQRPFEKCAVELVLEGFVYDSKEGSSNTDARGRTKTIILQGAVESIKEFNLAFFDNAQWKLVPPFNVDRFVTIIRVVEVSNGQVC